MTHPSKRKGSRFERDVADYLAANGFPHADRKVGHGTADRGDIAGVPTWTLECKATKRMELAEWMKEAEVEAVNGGTEHYAVIAKRRGRPVGDAYVVMPLSEWAAREAARIDDDRRRLGGAV